MLSPVPDTMGGSRRSAPWGQLYGDPIPQAKRLSPPRRAGP